MQRRRSFEFVSLLFILAMFCASTAIASPAQTFTILHVFAGYPTDGGNPYAGLVQGSDGNFYGTTFVGGAANSGTVFEVTPSGTLTTLHSFHYLGADGWAPFGGLLQATDGSFYGTTAATVFRITPSGTLTPLYRFCSQPNCADGEEPWGAMVQATDGNFYGTTNLGGSGTNCGLDGCGTVFRITPTGTLTTLHNFDGADGRGPWAALVYGADGNFYGTTGAGGAKDDGTVFKITPTGTLTTLHSFDNADGNDPVGSLVQGTDGNFYGTTSGGGEFTGGEVFKISAGGTLTALYSFNPYNSYDGTQSLAGLVQATDGNFYGTTSAGGTNGAGTLFKITPSGALTVLYNFCSQPNCADGYQPHAGLVQATDGSFYGTTFAGGSSGHNCQSYFQGCGTVFKLSGAISPDPLQFVPIMPCRLVDTRMSEGGDGPIQGGTFQIFNLPQLSQDKGCGDLSSAVAYSLNPAVVPQGPLGYLTLWPAGRPQPLVATMNSLDGRVKANAAIVPGGASEAISVFASNTTDVVLDIDGYFTPANQSTLAFYALTPCRVADTRDPNQPAGLGPPFMPGGQARDFPILTSNCQIPNSAAAYSFNFTAVPRIPLGYMTVWPTGQSQPVVSTLNAPTGTVTANAAIVPAGTDGDINVFPSNDTDLVIDVNGYFAAPGQNGLSLYPTVPCRVLDTRNGNGAFVGVLPVDVVYGPCSVPLTAQAYVFNATVVPSGPLGYLTLWPDGQNQPGVATLNAVDGAVTSNMAIVPASNGYIDAYASNLTQLIIDISSYFAP